MSAAGHFAAPRPAQQHQQKPAVEQDDDDSSDFDTDGDFSWISSFMSLKGHEFFCRVDEEYIHDQFNLTGLDELVTFYDFAIDLITDLEPEAPLSEDYHEMIDRDAETLYGMIHQRFILTPRGLHVMCDKFRRKHFGECPRIGCDNQPVLPVGTADLPKKESVKLFCPRCSEIFDPRAKRFARIDGAFFGTTFPHLFLLVYPEFVLNKPPKGYQPKVFGFRLHNTWYDASSKARATQVARLKAARAAKRAKARSLGASGAASSRKG